jgi:hypothetical protein
MWLVPSLQGGALWSWSRPGRRALESGKDSLAFREFSSQTTTELNPTERRKQGTQKEALGGKSQGKPGGTQGGGPRVTPAQRELQSAILKCTTSQEVLAIMQQAMDRDESVINHVHVAGALHRAAKFSKRSRGLRLDRETTFKRYVD